MRKQVWKKKVIQVLWLLAGIGVIVLLGAAMQKKNHQTCKDIKIDITGVEEHMFIDERDVKEILNSDGEIIGKDISGVNLRKMESLLEKNAWVKNAELFFDNEQVLNIQIEERQPVARVFTTQGSSFYIDTALTRLPLSEKISARVPVFTSFPSDKPVLTHSDSLLLKDVLTVGKYILADSFWMAQVSQVDISANGFEMIPTIGDHVVELGNAQDIESKFNRLYTFYTKAWLQNGMNTYEKLDVQYKNQVVAVKRGTGKQVIDSARAAQLVNEMMQQTTSMADTLQRLSTEQVNNMKPADTTRKAPAKPVTRVAATPPKKEPAKAATQTPPKPKPQAPVHKPATTTPAQTPKAVMNKRN